MDLFSCPFKPSRSKRSSHSHQANKTNINNPSSNSTNYHPGQSSIETSQSSTGRHDNNNNQTAHQQTTIPYRYVTEEFAAKAADEISVFPGDLVLYEFTDNCPGESWTHVLCTRTYKRGFVPSHILSTDPMRAALCKKKIPRSSNEATRVSPQTHPKAIGQLSSNSDNVHSQHHRHDHDFKPRFSVSHSQQSSSGNHSFQRYPDLRHLCPPAYLNVPNSESHCDCCEMDFRPFNREDLGFYVALYNFVAREENDLNVRPGDCLTLLNRDDEEWFWVRRDDGEEGFVPSKFICDYDHVKSFIDKGNSTVTLKSLNQNDFHTYINHRPDRESVPTDQQSSVFQ